MVRKIMQHICSLTVRFAFWFRYRIKTTNIEVLKDPDFKNKAVLVLSNHPAETDPLLLIALAGVELGVRPVVVENFYHYPGAKFFMKLLQAVPVPDFDSAVNEVKVKEGEHFHQRVLEVLRKKGSIMIYPSGTLKRRSTERIGGRSGVHRILQEVDDVAVLLVRVTGLWGSSFSTAQLGHTPPFWTQVIRAGLMILKNLFFFVPKREVIVEFEKAPPEFPFKGSKLELTRYLENWFDQYPTPTGRVKEEPLNLVPEVFWSKKKPKSIFDRQERDLLEGMQVPRDIRTNILFKLSEMTGIAVGKIEDDNDIVYDLGIDSIDKAEIFTFLDHEYDIDPAIIPADLVLVKDLFAVALKLKQPIQKSLQKKSEKKKQGWPHEPKRKPVSHLSDGKTVIEAFLNTSNKRNNTAACADAVVGVLSYKRFRLGVVILAKEIQKLEGNYVGIMLPSSAACAMLVLATQLAGKVPVMLNWTLGAYFMNHAVNLLGLKAVITSRRFLQKMQYLDLGEAQNIIVSIEDLRAGLSKFDKMKGLFTALKSPKKILNTFKVDQIGENDVAVVLFTSGTEGLPKAAQLSHKNILSNLEASLEHIDLKSDDILISILPFFHVFGCCVTGLLPLIYGYRTFYSPDPTDGHTIGNDCLIWKPTLIVLAPTFYDNLFKCCTFRQLRSIRLFASGAEKASEQLMNAVRNLGDEVQFIEGYGLTETSPVIALNPPYLPSRGVGRVLDNLDVQVIDPETGEVLKKTQSGEICVSGPSVFLGYYNSKTNPFIMINGKKYFRTGDKGHLDTDNYIYLEGRYKRFVKKGGEIINLSIMEEELFNRAVEKGIISSEWTHRPFAIMANEDSQRMPKLILFSEVKIDVEQVNELLREAKFSRLFKVTEVHMLKEIPLLSSGKVALGKLTEMMKQIYGVGLQ
jgi:long-chain-fatty-acid--[acyl-carrier-protein] ligase